MIARHDVQYVIVDRRIGGAWPLVRVLLREVGARDRRLRGGGRPRRMSRYDDLPEVDRVYDSGTSRSTTCGGSRDEAYGSPRSRSPRPSPAAAAVLAVVAPQAAWLRVPLGIAARPAAARLRARARAIPARRARPPRAHDGVARPQHRARRVPRPSPRTFARGTRTGLVDDRARRSDASRERSRVHPRRGVRRRSRSRGSAAAPRIRGVSAPWRRRL